MSLILAGLDNGRGRNIQGDESQSDSSSLASVSRSWSGSQSVPGESLGVPHSLAAGR